MKKFLLSVCPIGLLAYILWEAHRHAPLSGTTNNDPNGYGYTPLMWWVIVSGVVTIFLGSCMVIAHRRKIKEITKEEASADSSAGGAGLDEKAKKEAETKTKAEAEAKSTKKDGIVFGSTKWLGKAFLGFMAINLIAGALMFIVGLCLNLSQGSLFGKTYVPPEKRWQLTWTKPPGVTGRDASVTTRSFPVQMIRNDSYAMEFIAFYMNSGQRQEARFIWEKSRQRGECYQKYPNQSGTWYLVEMKPGLWTGKQTDNGEEFDMTLQLNPE